MEERNKIQKSVTLPSGLEKSLLPEARNRCASVLTRYGDFAIFQRTFHPSNAKVFMETHGEDDMIAGDYPTLRIVKFTYGLNNVLALICLYLLDLANFNGNTRATATQFVSIAEVFDTRASGLKITEVILFFHLFKCGYFRDSNGNDRSKMYGSFSGHPILDCLDAFRQYRQRRIEEITSREEMRKRQERESDIVVDASKYINEIMRRFDAKAKAIEAGRQQEVNDHNREFLAILANEKK